MAERYSTPAVPSTSMATPENLALPLGAETVDAIADLHGEPDWMREARRDAWATYAAMDFPRKDEEAWRRTDLSRYPLDDMRVVFSGVELDSIEDLPPCWNYTLAPAGLVSGVLVHCNGARTHATMRPEIAGQGVVFEGLHRALRTHGDLIRRYWMQGTTTRPNFSKFTALNAALWHGGTFVHVPAGVNVARPLQSLISYDADGGTGLHHTLVVAETGSRVTLIQDRVSQDLKDEVNAEVVEIYAEAGARVRYVSLQHWGHHRYSVSVQEAQVAQDANMVWVAGSMGGGMTKEFLRANLNATRARSTMAGFSFPYDHQHVDQSTYQHHRAPNTYSDLLFRNVLRDRARTVFYGMIRIETQAGGGTEGYQVNNNLLLDDARAHAIPGLEIIANDVRCSHGATVSHIDPEELFYLQARGLPRPSAESLMVQGLVPWVIPCLLLEK